MLQPAVTMAEVYGSGLIFSTRPPRAASTFLRGRRTRADRDMGTAAFLTSAGGSVGIASRWTVTPAVSDLLEEAGLPLPEDRLEYSDERGYERLLARLARQGRQVLVTHAHPLDQLPTSAWVCHPALLTRLNDKAELPHLVPARHAPRRVTVPVAEARAAARRHRLPFLLKASCRWSSASGMGVRIITDPAQVGPALREWRGVRRVILEEYVSFDRTWCLNYTTDGRRVRYLGAGEQQIDGTAYLGSWVDRRSRAPQEAVEVGTAVMERARVLGYVGFAGFDTGLRPDGRPVVFDLNFRHCGSTIPLLLRRALARRPRHPAACSTTVRYTHPGGASRLLAGVRRTTRAGVFLPYAIFTPPETRRTRSCVYGLVLGADRDDVRRNLDRMSRLGFR